MINDATDEEKRANWRLDTCPVCGKQCIGRTKFGAEERNCGSHYWKWDDGVKVVLKPITGKGSV